MAEYVLRSLLDEAGWGGRVVVDSAGTGDWHVGDGADPRALRVLIDGGYDAAAHRARRFDAAWWAERDLILVADRSHLRALTAMAPTPDDAGAVRLLRSFDPQAVAADTLDVDDPYYGGAADFARCLHEVEAACRGVVDHLDRLLRTADG